MIKEETINNYKNEIKKLKNKIMENSLSGEKDLKSRLDVLNRNLQINSNRLNEKMQDQAIEFKQINDFGIKIIVK